MSTFPSPSSGNGPLEHESYQKFFDGWISEQNQYLHDLISATKNPRNDVVATNDDPEAVEWSTMEQDVGALFDRVVQHYEGYYKIKSSWVKHDAVSMLTPSWRSSLEDAFLWIGGWRPSTAFHLLYSKSGLQLEPRLEEVIHGLTADDLGDLSPRQMVDIDSLQRQTIKEEKGIAEKMAKHQETIADPSMVEMSHEATKSIMEGGEVEFGAVEERLKTTLVQKEGELKDLVQMADELRLGTLKGIIQILTKRQVIHFLIAAAELHLRIHEWGMWRDTRER